MKKVGNWIKGNIIGIFLTLLSIFFVFSGMIKIGTQQLNWKELLLFVSSTLIFGVVITTLVAEGGYSAGKKDPDFIATRKEAVLTAKKAIPWRDEAELYVNREIDKSIVEDRKDVLHPAGIKYDEVFGELGQYIMDKETFKKLRHVQKKAVIKARLIVKHDFTLFGFASGKSIGRKKAPSETERRKTQLLTTFLTRIAIAIVSGCIMFQYIGISFASILYAIYQLLIWIGTGLLTRQSNFNYITVEVREYDQDRIWNLNSFLALSQEDKDALTKEVGKIKVVEQFEEHQNNTNEN